jgi:hypothetical protein
VLLAVVRFDTFARRDDFSVERKMKIRIVYNDEPIVPFRHDVFTDPEDLLI